MSALRILVPVKRVIDYAVRRDHRWNVHHANQRPGQAPREQDPDGD